MNPTSEQIWLKKGLKNQNHWVVDVLSLSKKHTVKPKLLGTTLLIRFYTMLKTYRNTAKGVFGFLCIYIYTETDPLNRS